MRNAGKILIGKPDGKRRLGIPRRRCEDNIKIYSRETGLDGMDYSRVAQNRKRCHSFLNIVMSLRVP
jgi:hypothetical protein